MCFININDIKKSNLISRQKPGWETGENRYSVLKARQLQKKTWGTI